MRGYGRRTAATLACLGGLAAWLVTGATSDASASGPAAKGAGHSAAAGGSALAPKVVHTGTGPTGYQVTFRFRAPEARTVQIKGEWYFADPYRLSALAGTSTTTVQTPGTTPGHWSPGDIPIGSPNSSAANWPVTAMTKDKHTGIWSYTVPLPSGVFNYGFYVDCASATQTGCTEVSDPANQPWNQQGTKVTGSTESLSQVYVPSDPKFATADLAWQGPSREHGTLRDVAYPAPTSTDPVGRNYLAVYTPPGYDPKRAKPYPTVYLNSGGSNEMDWSTQGDLGNILDNLITTGEIQPMVVVMPNTQGFPASSSYASFDAALVDSAIPYVEAHYHVSTSAGQRAIGGLGYGASITNSFLFDDPSVFAYYGVMSPGLNGDFTLPDAASLSAAQVAAMKKAGIMVGGGWQDPSHYYHASEVATLAAVGVPVTPDYVNGGHSWYAWRLLVRDFLTKVAFFPPAAA
ncbi:putative esterase [Actinacidiphila reveromycinica]|uniref:Putative esterase n=1 Tax=Actinacidiphila reveromycinica TaxID=659352 RepID=A0A7U3UN41_9ACTN|nr:alpha/beta hydrolase-fold protein [Streptomyces sp. SN-593]BBA95591.1 putative esterase [Streptomyces sp. SN-593]